MDHTQVTAVLLYILISLFVIAGGMVFLERLIDKEIKKMKAKNLKTVELEVWKNKKKIS